jgi:DNA-binding protein Fis
MLQPDWKPLYNYEGFYEINRNGDVRSLHKRNYHKIVSQRIDRGGYYAVRLHKNGTTSTQWAHRLLALTLIPNPYNKKHVNHKNGTKLDNSLSNLEWVTHQENVIDAYKQGLNSAAKRTIDSVTGSIYSSIREAADAIGLNYSTCRKRLKRNCPSIPLRYVG